MEEKNDAPNDIRHMSEDAMRSFCRENKVEILDQPECASLRVGGKMYTGPGRWEAACKDWIVKTACTGSPKERPEEIGSSELLLQMEAERGFRSLIEDSMLPFAGKVRDEEMAKMCDFPIRIEDYYIEGVPGAPNFIYAIYVNGGKKPVLSVGGKLWFYLWKHRHDDLMILRFQIEYGDTRVNAWTGRLRCLSYDGTSEMETRQYLRFLTANLGSYVNVGGDKWIKGLGSVYISIWQDGKLTNPELANNPSYNTTLIENVTHLVSWKPDCVKEAGGHSVGDDWYLPNPDGFIRIDYSSDRDTIWRWHFAGFLEFCPARDLKGLVPDGYMELMYVRHVFSFIESEIKTLNIIIKLPGMPDEVVGIRSWGDFMAVCSARIEGDWIAYKGRTRVRGYRDLADRDEIILLEKGE